jgi:hypothetical protein
VYGRLDVCDAAAPSSDIARFGSHAQREGVPSPFVATLGSCVAAVLSTDRSSRGVALARDSVSQCQALTRA